MALFYYIYVNLAKKKHPDAIKDHKIRDLRQTREFWYFDIIGRFRLEMFFLGEYKKYDLLEASRSGNDIKLMSLLTPLNVNCHASDGRKSTPLHLAAGYNRARIVQLLLQVRMY